MGEIGTNERWNPFYKLFDVLQQSYPALHKHARIDKVKTGLLYTFKGSTLSLKPTLFTAHQDVVPVANSLAW
ncbi:hypothetical protein BDV10DRAFT_180137 [Aspergillus recurvatus]